MSRIALIGENSIEYVSILLDIWNQGDCAVLLDWNIPFQTALDMMKDADVHTCYIEKKYLNQTETILPSDIEFFTYENSWKGIPKFLPNEIYRKFQNNDSRDEAVVIYSSGTTGTCKGIVLSHYAIHTNAETIMDYMKPTAKDCIYICKSLSHSSTLVGELLVALKSGMSLVIAPIIVPPRYTLSQIIKYRVTILCANPTLLFMYADEYRRNKYDLTSLKTIYVSGSILSDQVYKAVHQAFDPIPIYNVYGLSEAGPRVTAQRSDCCKSNSVGTPIKGIEVVVVNEQGIPVPNGEYGIIHVKTPSLFDGYVVGEEKQLSLYKDWYHTGDVGYIDSFGELHIVNRLDDVIILNSHKIYPSEIEQQIIEYATVKECAVVKIESNGREFMGCLYVGNKKIDHEIKEKLKTKLMTYEIPKYFLKCSNLPRTNNGKIAVHEVQAYLERHINQE